MVRAYENKIAIYLTPEFIEAVKTRYPAMNIYALPFVIGASETWCHGNKDLLRHLDLNKKEIGDIIHTALKGAWYAHKHFMKAFWSKQLSSRNNPQMALLKTKIEAGTAASSAGILL